MAMEVRGHHVDTAEDGATGVARAIELSETKYCSVRGMLGPQVEVVTSYRVSKTRE